MKNHKLIYESDPKLFPEIQKHINETKAIAFSNDWMIQRKWLNENGVNFKKYREEKKMQKYMKKFDFE